MRGTKVCAFVAFFVLTHVTTGISDDPDSMKLLRDCREKCKEIKDYTGRFTKREFLRGKLKDTEVIFIREWVGAMVPARTPGPKHSRFSSSKGPTLGPTSSYIILTFMPLPPIKARV